jgi:outer membrane biosynthesis protein TonB
MNRMQKKCLLASLALHALLCVILLVGPAFLSSDKRGVDQPTLEVIPSKIIDSLFSGGGNPKANPAAAQKVVEPPAPAQTEPRPPVPTPKPPQIKEQVAEVRQTVVEKTKPDVVEKTATQKPGIKVSNTLVKRASEKDMEEKTRTEADAKAQVEARAKADAAARRRTTQQMESRLNSAFESLSKNLSSGTTIEPLGPGGEAYADYGQVVKSYYDQAWIDPEDVSQDAATVKVKVVIRRDGTVILDSIQKRSGVAALDKSVQNALDRVRLRGLPQFPEGAKESQRIYIINFNLKAKRLIG